MNSFSVASATSESSSPPAGVAAHDPLRIERVGKSSVLMRGRAATAPRAIENPVVVFRNWVDREFHRRRPRLHRGVWTQRLTNRNRPSLAFRRNLAACGEAATDGIGAAGSVREYFLSPEINGSGVVRGAVRTRREPRRRRCRLPDRPARRRLGQARPFQERIPNLLSNRFRLNRLDATGAAVAIRNPLGVWNDKHAAASLHPYQDDLSRIDPGGTVGQVSGPHRQRRCAAEEVH